MRLLATVSILGAGAQCHCRPAFGCASCQWHPAHLTGLGSQSPHRNPGLDACSGCERQPEIHEEVGRSTAGTAGAQRRWQQLSGTTSAGAAAGQAAYGCFGKTEGRSITAASLPNDEHPQVPGACKKGAKCNAAERAVRVAGTAAGIRHQASGSRQQAAGSRVAPSGQRGPISAAATECCLSTHLR